jgi:hypothetical protein
MTVVGLRTVKELRGEPCIPLEVTSPAKKLITVSRSFGATTASLDALRAAVAFYVTRAAEKRIPAAARRDKSESNPILTWLMRELHSNRRQRSRLLMCEADRASPVPSCTGWPTARVQPAS